MQREPMETAARCVGMMLILQSRAGVLNYTASGPMRGLSTDA